jgi:hypothetical protein
MVARVEVRQRARSARSGRIAPGGRGDGRCLGLLACCLAAFGLVGCGVVGRVRDCNRAAETIQEQLVQVRIRLPDAEHQPSAYLDIAAAYEALAWRLARLPVGDVSLAGALESYGEVVDRAARHSRAYARALDRPDRGRKKRSKRREALDRIRGQVTAERSREQAVFRKLSAVCHPR